MTVALALLIIILSISLLFLLQSHEVVARISSKVIPKAETGDEKLTLETLHHLTESPITSLSVLSTVTKFLNEMDKCSHTERQLKMLKITRYKRGVGFPSLEASLLSLAFLTFAVYLVNLIQSIIKLMHSRQL